MSAVFRIKGAESIEVSLGWELRPQIQDVCSWLSIPENAEIVRDSVLDIGFNCRLNATMVAVQGETIPTDFMGILASLNVTLWLSIYPPFVDPSARS